VHHGRIFDGDRLIDEVMLALMRAPRTATGDDVVEITAHGGPVVLEHIVQLCRRHGARLAARGEFTFRAFIHRKLDLAQAEAVADLIDSKTSLGAEAALTQLSGTLSSRVQAFRSKLIDLLAQLEVALDYAEENIQFIAPPELAAALTALQQDIASLSQTAAKGKFLRDGLRAAIVGRPNAGKSSLLNALLERDRAIVTAIPGTTRDVLEELLDVRGIPVILMDTAGLRAHTADPVEAIGHDRTRTALAQADIVLWVIDATTPLSDEDRYIAALLTEKNKTKSTVILLNKCDQSRALPDTAVAGLVPGARPLAISALTRQGLEQIEEALVRAADTGAPAPDIPLVNARHRAALERTAHALAEAQAAAKSGATEEIIAFHLREALNILGEITGETTTDEILDNIFSHFCVGK
jgi:tRNA modification GTPase